MQHFSYESSVKMKEIFYMEPEPFTKYTDKEVLAYALGATLYMPAIKANIAKDIINKKYQELTSLVIDLEDSVADCIVVDAENKLLEHLCTLSEHLEENKISIDELPLIFIRVRDPIQMRRITKLINDYLYILTGFVFPKFNYENGKEFLAILDEINKNNSLLYGMPILESAEIIYKETRMDALLKIKELLDSYKSYILNIRIGATDFSGLFGIRRKVDTTIYDVSVIRDCITDIINLFTRQGDEYVVSGPVWEFFSKDNRILKPTLRVSPFQRRYGSSGLVKRTELINEYLDGLINEVLLDKLNGINGKTIIHPTHIKAVHSLYTITHEEYLDAISIIANREGDAGVLKSMYENKMNEMKPHYYWAKKILLRAKVFGVYNVDQDFTSLLLNQGYDEQILEVK
ncbi:HpcH/HpaI aldolase/citrate lyase family protein [Pradoshia sp. D12]|uniref:HpcH/HpaI aldolase/citrate lyase family protein n=1 Tax=Bacillaceae TaxID=186817 RepID=UPI0011281004|nr:MULTISPECIES: HpcH/HpaI aldolase/citrate lyase family protein [Bacillaceae]QFK71443.1 HpcH/HpaI aldolase/citrate lyase family protein [Pradoshia sp. D12]TPF73238.1 HpcH/HpaI aldolase/citrate lyase family protein [Bacillus sp. D12]